MKKILLSVFVFSILLPTFAFASFDTSLKYGSKGDAVSNLQDFLVSQGFLKGNVDGSFGLVTLKAVEAFQSANGLSADGYFGKASRAKANDILATILQPSNTAEQAETGTVATVPTVAGCTATSAYSSTTGQPCNSTTQPTPNLPAGCISASGYSITTGQACNGIATAVQQIQQTVQQIAQNTTPTTTPNTSTQTSLSFSQSNPTLIGQITIGISGGSGSYTVLNNSSQNNGVVATSISGSNITLTTSSNTGSASITVCSTNMTSCGIINVTIGNAIPPSTISFSQSNPTIIDGASSNISIFGPTSSFFYVSSNSNPSVVQANISSNTLTLLGIANGTSTINVCASSSNCGSLAVIVTANTTPTAPNTTANVTFSQSSPTITIGQSMSINVFGPSNTTFSIASNSNSSVVQASLSGETLSLLGITNGSSVISVCASTNNCGALTITVNIAPVLNPTELSVSHNTGYASQNVNPNSNGVIIGSYTIQNQNSSEAIRVTSFQIGLTDANGNPLSSTSTPSINNFSTLATSQTSGSGATPIQPSASNTFPVNFTIQPNATYTLNVLASTGSDSSDSRFATNLVVTSVGVSSGVVVSQNGNGTAIQGQVMTLGNSQLSSISLVTGNSTPAQQISVGSAGATNATKAEFNFQSSGGTSTISELKFTVNDSVNGATVASIGVNGIYAPVVAGVAYLTGLNLSVPNGGGGLNQDVFVSYAPISSNVPSGTTSSISLSYIKYASNLAGTFTSCNSGCNETLSPVSAPTMTLE